MKRRILRTLERYGGELDNLRAQVKKLESERVQCVVEFETGALLHVDCAVAIPVWKESNPTRHGEGRRPFAVADALVKRPPVNQYAYGTADCTIQIGMACSYTTPQEPTDLQKYLEVKDKGTVRWYATDEAPDCDFIDASGKKDRFVKLEAASTPKKR